MSGFGITSEKISSIGCTKLIEGIVSGILLRIFADAALLQSIQDAETVFQPVEDLLRRSLSCSFVHRSERFGRAWVYSCVDDYDKGY
jgi:hypothetical protein